ncbi:hypothetical protein BKA70DRAFT_271338 [Coprinopsis sp. MPI-PUGE-AT-0042]|nr:hypothetical protein BKA70DRAFT_271338 [Coprinopsis sp. MPI-PUGE-AT-0042]
MSTFSSKKWPLQIFNLAEKAVSSASTGHQALLISIQYGSTPWAGTPFELIQPPHDVQLMKEYLMQYAGFSENDITVLTDARGTPKHLLPTYVNIMREIKRLKTSHCQNILFFYIGHSDQRRWPKQSAVEEFDQCVCIQAGDDPHSLTHSHPSSVIIPIDAVTGPELKDINMDLVILDHDLRKYLTLNLPRRSTFLAILDTCHSATLFDLKHHYFNWTFTLKSLLRRSVRKGMRIAVPDLCPCSIFYYDLSVVVEPLWKIFMDGGLANDFSYGLGGRQACNVVCSSFVLCIFLQVEFICMQVTISASKAYETGRSLTETIVGLLSKKHHTSITVSRLNRSLEGPTRLLAYSTSSTPFCSSLSSNRN